MKNSTFECFAHAFFILIHFAANVVLCHGMTWAELLGAVLVLTSINPFTPVDANWHL